MTDSASTSDVSNQVVSILQSIAPMLPLRCLAHPLMQDNGSVIKDMQSIPIRASISDRCCSGSTVRKMTDCPRRMLNLLHSAKHRRKSRM